MELARVPRLEGKLVEFSKLAELRNKYRHKTITHCHGVFDLLHPGHQAYFMSAKKHGDLLVVSVTDDRFVNKGPGRPHYSVMVRAKMLCALEIVDFVVISPFATAVQVIDELKPDTYVKGPDYRDKSLDPTGGIFKEEEAVRRHGGELVFTDDETQSSSELLNRFFTSWGDKQTETLNSIRKLGGFEAIQEILDRLSKLSVTVIGEPIIDNYVFCTPEGISSKSPSISARFKYEEHYMGGSLAIANHLADFVQEINLLITHGGEPYFKTMLGSKLDKRVRLIDHVLEGVPTPKKTRFVESEGLQRIFELTDLKANQWDLHSPKEFCKTVLSETKGKDCTIIADFGHGMFEGQALQSLTDIGGFIGLNVQTNSSNFAFNPFTKHRRFSYLSIDTKEARLAYHDRFSDPLFLAKRVRDEYCKDGSRVAVTLGPHGSYLLGRGSEAEIHVPAFADGVIDPIGAGDAFFAITSLLVKAGCPDVMVPFIGNVFAGLKTKIIGNKSAVSRGQLVKALSSMLK